MKCKNCKMEIKPAVVFCEHCGAPVKRTKKAPLIIGTMIAVLIITTIAVIFITEKGSKAYEEQLNIGYELLSKGEYEESVLAFDKAIKIEEKRPEGYMGKAEAMAHDPNMTTEKAEEIVEVLETGYRKSRSNKVLEHKTVVGNIIRKNGFEKEAEIVEEIDSERNFVMTSGLAVSGNKVIFSNENGIEVTDEKTGEKVWLLENVSNPSFVTNGKLIYAIDGSFGANPKKVYKIDIGTKAVKEIYSITPSEEDIAVIEGENEGFNVNIVGCNEKYLYLMSWFDGGHFSANRLNFETQEYKKMSFSEKYKCCPDEVMTYKDKIYYNNAFADEILDPLYEANPDGSGERVIAENVIQYELIGNKMYYTCSNDKNARFQDDIVTVEKRVINLDTGEDKLLEKGLKKEVSISLTASALGYKSPDYESSYFVTKLNDGALLYSKYTGPEFGNKYIVSLKDKISKPFRLEGEIAYYSKGKIYYTEEKYDGAGSKFTWGVIRLEFEDGKEQREAYKEAYADFLEKKLGSYSDQEGYGFSLVYIDDDKTPELVLNYGNYHAAGADIFLYKDGKVIKLGRDNETDNDIGNFGSNGQVSYSEKAGLIESSYSGMGITTRTIYKLENEQVKRLCDFYLDWNDEENIEYRINEKIVSEAEFKEVEEKYNKGTWKSSIEDGVHYDLTLENIEEILQ